MTVEIQTGKTKTEIVQAEIATAWLKGKVVSGPIIRRYQMRETTPDEEAKGRVPVKAHERVKIVVIFANETFLEFLLD